MDIAFIHHRYPGAEGTGATFSATRIVDGLARTEHDVTVFCLDEPEDDDAITTEADVEVLDVSGYPYHQVFQRNRAIVERASDFAGFDVLHSYLMTTIPGVAKVGERTGVRTIVTLNAYKGVCPKNDLVYHTGEKCDSNGIARCSNCIVKTNFSEGVGGAVSVAYRFGVLKEIAGRPHARIDGFHAISDHVKETYARFGYRENKIDVIPNILDDRFSIDHESDFAPPYRLLYVGALRPRKGVRKLPGICRRLVDRTDDRFEMTIVGDGESRAYIDEELDRLDLEDRVSMLGQVPNEDLPKIYASHDAFIYPGTWDEPFGRVFLEALAAGTPVVSADVGSVRSIVGTGGVIVNGRPEEFVSEIVDLTENSQLRSLSSNAKAEAARYRTENVIPDLVDLYGRPA